MVSESELIDLTSRLKELGATTVIGILPKLTPEQLRWAMTMTNDEIETTERLFTEHPPLNPQARWNGIMEEMEYARNF